MPHNAQDWGQSGTVLLFHLLHHLHGEAVLEEQGKLSLPPLTYASPSTTQRSQLRLRVWTHSQGSGSCLLTCCFISQVSRSWGRTSQSAGSMQGALHHCPGPSWKLLRIPLWSIPREYSHFAELKTLVQQEFPGASTCLHMNRD